MGRSNIPVKTSEGAQEIKVRALGLAPRIRTALLLVDGVKSVAELERLMAAAGVTAGALQLLIDKGLIRFQEEEKLPAALAPALSRVEATPAAEATQATHTGESTQSPESNIAKEKELPVTQVPEKKTAPQFNASESEPEFLIEVPPLNAPPIPKHIKASPQMEDVDVAPEPDLFPEVITPFSQASTGKESESELVSPLEVATLIELETILGEVTKMEMDTILGIATKLELTPTQMLVQAQQAPSSAIAAPAATPPRLPPLAQAEYDFKMAATNVQPVIPAAVLRMNLTVARAHLANALDQYLGIDGYALKQKVVACDARAELEQLFRIVEAALTQKLDRATVLRIMGVAQALLER